MSEACQVCEPWDEDEGARGWCPRCGFFFDQFGRRLLEPWLTCRVHAELQAGCPHSGALKR